MPAEHALLGFEGVRAYAGDPGATAPGCWSAWACSPPSPTASGSPRAPSGTRTLRYDAPPAGRGRQGAGSVHHIAWSAADDAELDGLPAARHRRAGARPTPIIDRQYFHSVYFREPSGVLFELASRDIGFTYDEPEPELGQDAEAAAAVRVAPRGSSRSG